jgi:hypothetical protein
VRLTTFGGGTSGPSSQPRTPTPFPLPCSGGYLGRPQHETGAHFSRMNRNSEKTSPRCAESRSYLSLAPSFLSRLRNFGQNSA